MSTHQCDHTHDHSHDHDHSHSHSHEGPATQMQNPQPVLHQRFELTEHALKIRREQEFNNQVDDEIDQLEIFDMIRHLNDPEYPVTLEQLNVVNLERCQLSYPLVKVNYTPTIPHCSMAQIIGLMIKVKLAKYLPKGLKTMVTVTPGTHVKEKQINKQINDKERVAAAIQNPNIHRILKQGFQGSDRYQIPF